MALTPAARHLAPQVSLLFLYKLPNIAPPITWVTRTSLSQPSLVCPMGFRLSRVIAITPSSPTESSSLSCALPVRHQLLPTPPHSDAATFSYRALAYLTRTFTVLFVRLAGARKPRLVHGRPRLRHGRHRLGQRNANTGFGNPLLGLRKPNAGY